MKDGTAAVLGAGIQGACVAMALAARGHRVSLIDQMPEPMLRASLRNEGKVHLGFTYANDPSFRTAELMLESALSFAPLIDGWMPTPIDWGSFRSRPFTYLIMRDSMVSADELRNHYERVAERYRGSPGRSDGYLGVRPDRLCRSIPTPAYVDPETVRGAVETAEVAINLGELRRRLVAGLEASERITWCPGRRVESVARNARGFVVEGRQRSGDGRWKTEADFVVNCLWEGRLAIDEQLGMTPTRPWVHRLKYRVVGVLPRGLSELPSLTLALGAYGDIVPMGDSSYFSWYPSCRRGWSSDLSPPPEWNHACDGIVDADLEASLPKEVLGALDRVVPGIRDARPTAVDAGIVFSWGETDIDRIDSRFHQRFAIGVQGGDGYYSIDTGKLTCAPLFARRLLERLP